jgi:hypothetical protein
VNRIFLIAKNAFRAVMSQRALFMWGFAVVIMFLRSGPALFTSQGTEMATFLRANAVSGSLDLWSYLCLAAAIYLGATSVSTDLRTKTIITVLARPVRRWELLIGKWLGLSAFCVVTLGLGVVLAFGLSRYLGVNMDGDVLAISATRTIAGIVLFCGIAAVLSSSGSAPVAVAVTMFVAIVPNLIQPLRADSHPTYHRIGVALDPLVPPGYESNYNGVVWAPLPIPQNMRGRLPQTLPQAMRQRPTVDYPEQQKQTAETVGYAGVYFVIGCVLFGRRDLKFS